MSWSRKLSKVLYTTDGKTLRTLSDARAYAVMLPDNCSSRNHWQRAELMLEAAADADSVAVASRQIETALFLDMLDVKRTTA